ncbi:molybdopterin molybdotransferase MoeA [Novosphingobium colocasiae]|uniref:Molybdopterin molybdenumtransferase n=1 Tax=Novosphingobium colocasiae TaxID=1256513 RepID=A0A918PHP9_9SPHN|nr:molybdopterin molybdotransferase MoeA [Novosphingobium colocasiae]GGZ10640.1 molybdopterin molybdenumtransferase MoeA [Novosphingobium colocasiae]
MARSPLLALEEAQARLLALAAPLQIERVDVDSALGRFLAEPLLARRTQPAADLSAMDGYAVTRHDMAGPWRVIGESAAGHPFPHSVEPGQAVRISTGALIPEGAGAVVLQEDLSREDETVRLTGTPPDPPHRHIRRCGMDFCAGDAVLDAGTPVGPAQIALALSAGHRHIPVTRRPTLAIVDSGDELAVDPESCARHQIPASNGPMLDALVRSLPVDTRRLGPVPDRLDTLIAAFEAAADVDVIVTSGGASVGDHDLIRPALEAWGATLGFWRVGIKPGKPILVAERAVGGHRQLVVGLPGNPVSGFVTGYLFLLPLLRKLMGAAQPLPRTIATRAAAPMPATGSRREFVRAVWDGDSATPVNVQDSGALAALSASNALIDRPAHAPAILVGDPVRIFLLQNGGIA